MGSIFDKIIEFPYCGMTLRGFNCDGEFRILSIILPFRYRLSVKQAMALQVILEKGNFDKISFYNPLNKIKGVSSIVILREVRRTIPESIIPPQSIEKLILLREKGKSIKFISPKEEIPKKCRPYKLPSYIY